MLNFGIFYNISHMIRQQKKGGSDEQALSHHAASWCDSLKQKTNEK